MQPELFALSPRRQSPFESALDLESRYLAVIPNQTMPSDKSAGHRVYIGPVRLPFEGTHYLSSLNADQQPPRPAPDSPC